MTFCDYRSRRKREREERVGMEAKVRQCEYDVLPGRRLISHCFDQWPMPTLFLSFSLSLFLAAIIDVYHLHSDTTKNGGSFLLYQLFALGATLFYYAVRSLLGRPNRPASSVTDREPSHPQEGGSGGGQSGK
ncbi:hypothetical protein B0F90DRAFT_393629 [Multifurca ochricompacta]|uniref:Uncharacterized protein n=1 Tax=Multifurca ochricompacta TaxID=376703 RepID=A0AAD4M3E5_9AGAM|nr:hypothetical protein B0F90DRAFT_393629 [Multifurca ochricompacta]